MDPNGSGATSTIWAAPPSVNWQLILPVVIWYDGKDDEEDGGVNAIKEEKEVHLR